MIVAKFNIQLENNEEMVFKIMVFSSHCMTQFYIWKHLLLFYTLESVYIVACFICGFQFQQKEFIHAYSIP